MPLHLKSTGIDFADFGNHGQVIAEILDDYEEGVYSWTCVSNGSGAWVTRSGYDTICYHKIGGHCWVGGRIETTTGWNVSSGTFARLSIPFACSDLSDFAGRSLMSFAQWSWGTSTTVVFGRIIEGTSYGETYKLDGSDGQAAIEPDQYFEAIISTHYPTA